MIFDHTYIAIRRRNVLEILDLSLHVIRHYLAPLSVLWIVGIAPMMLINWLLIGWLGADYYDSTNLTLYFYLMFLLIVTQSHIATLPITIFLGKSMFAESPGIGETLVATLKSNFAMIWVHGGLRLLIPIMLLMLLINNNTDQDSIALATVWISILVFIAALVRFARPFASEILCLEKTAFFKKGDQVNYGVRSSSLHHAASGELFGRACIVALFLLPLTITVTGTLLSIDSLLNLFSNFESLPLVFYGPLAGWIVAGYLAVARFLSYIDIRIRQEGWEVELRIRAEAMRIQESMGVAS